jgi:hypothetical protein
MEDALQHWGVLGMHWGRTTGGGNSSHGGHRDRSTRTVSDDHRIAESLKTKNVQEMTNAEIRTLATRLQLEAQYRNLKPDKKTRGKQRVDNILKTIGWGTTAVSTIGGAVVTGKKIFDYARKPETQAMAKKIMAKARLATKVV